MQTDKVWFTSDTHAFHRSIMKFCPETRNGAEHGMDADAMTEEMLNRWNEQVSPEDIVYHLGDVSFGNPYKTLKWLNKLNGTIHLIKGNHEGKNMMNVISPRFASICDYKYLRLNGNKFALFHFPIMEWNAIHHGSMHLHGHVHGKETGVGGKILDVGIDTRPNFQLYSEQEVLEILENKPIREHH